MANDAQASDAGRLSVESMELGDSNHTYRYLLSNGQVITVRETLWVRVNTPGTWEGSRGALRVLDDQGEELGFLVFGRNADGNLAYAVAYAADDGHNPDVDHWWADIYGNPLDDGRSYDPHQWVDIVGEPVEDRYEALAALLNLDHFYLAPRRATPRHLAARARIARIRACGLNASEHAGESGAPADRPAVE